MQEEIFEGSSQYPHRWAGSPESILKSGTGTPWRGVVGREDGFLPHHRLIGSLTSGSTIHLRDRCRGLSQNRVGQHNPLHQASFRYQVQGTCHLKTL